MGVLTTGETVIGVEVVVVAEVEMGWTEDEETVVKVGGTKTGWTVVGCTVEVVVVVLLVVVVVGATVTGLVVVELVVVEEVLGCVVVVVLVDG